MDIGTGIFFAWAFAYVLTAAATAARGILRAYRARKAKKSARKCDAWMYF